MVTEKEEESTNEVAIDGKVFCGKCKTDTSTWYEAYYKEETLYLECKECGALYQVGNNKTKGIENE